MGTGILLKPCSSRDYASRRLYPEWTGNNRKTPYLETSHKNCNLPNVEGFKKRIHVYHLPSPLEPKHTNYCYFFVPFLQNEYCYPPHLILPLSVHDYPGKKQKYSRLEFRVLGITQLYLTNNIQCILIIFSTIRRRCFTRGHHQIKTAKTL